MVAILNFWSHFKKIDWMMTGATMTLCAISLMTLYSINFGKPDFLFFKKQAFFVLLGILMMFLLSYFDARFLKNNRSALILLYLFGLALLAGVLFFGGLTRGTASWFKIWGFGFEPVELMKIIIILVMAKFFSLRHVEMYRARHIIASGLYVFLPIALVLLQPDIGSAMILGIMWIGLVILAGIELRHLLLVLLCLAIVFGIAWFGALKPFQKDRILTFINPQYDPFGASYNLIQSKIAIGEGGLFGRGPGRGIQGRLDFLPEKHTDFIFAAYAEEWGFAGVLFLITVFGILFFRLIKTALQNHNNFSRIFCAGVCLMLFAEVFINIGATLGLVPITGIALPFISYGGSSLFANFLALGIVQGLVVRGG